MTAIPGLNAASVLAAARRRAGGGAATGAGVPPAPPSPRLSGDPRARGCAPRSFPSSASICSRISASSASVGCHARPTARRATTRGAQSRRHEAKHGTSCRWRTTTPASTRADRSSGLQEDGRGAAAVERGRRRRSRGFEMADLRRSRRRARKRGIVVGRQAVRARCEQRAIETLRRAASAPRRRRRARCSRADARPHGRAARAACPRAAGPDKQRERRGSREEHENKPDRAPPATSRRAAIEFAVHLVQRVETNAQCADAAATARRPF